MSEHDRCCNIKHSNSSLTKIRYLSYSPLMICHHKGKPEEISLRITYGSDLMS